MSGVTSFYVAEGPDRFLPQRSTAGPWGHDSQHGGPPAALLTRGVEQLAGDGDRVVGRLTMELLGPVPLTPLRLSASVVRPGRSVCFTTSRRGGFWSSISAAAPRPGLEEVTVRSVR